MKDVNPSYEASFWNQKWIDKQTGWDIGYASPAITEFMKDYQNKSATILIPGCGNAYEADFLLENGFTNITLLDISEEMVSMLKSKYKDNPSMKVINEDFYAHQNRYDVIIEQTFFCANPKTSREQYAKHTAELLNTDGIIIGVLFNREFENDYPPFGGNEIEYRTLFKPYFQIKKMDDCYNSIPPRAGSELFIHLIKKD